MNILRDFYKIISLSPAVHFENIYYKAKVKIMSYVNNLELHFLIYLQNMVDNRTEHLVLIQALSVLLDIPLFAFHSPTLLKKKKSVG